MKFNLHTHTTRCGHAIGEDEEYVLKAIENGYEMIGFSDHAPFLFPNQKKTSSYRIQLDMADDYAQSIRALQKKYKDKIDIKLGYELEWYPELMDTELEYLSQFNYDYLILGQHFIGNEYEKWSKYSAMDVEEVVFLDKYISQVLLGARSGYFTYVAHPDVIKFTGDRNVYLRKMRYMIEQLKKINIPLEFNFLGYVDKRHYPSEDFWKMVAEIGNPVVIGLDAHEPDFYGKPEVNEMRSYMQSLGLNIIDEIEIIKK